jgi:hypothetical protein
MPEVVLVHGLALDRDDWHDVMWGDPRQGRCGRVVRGIQYAYTRGADQVVFGGAGSRRAGRSDAEVALDLARTGAGHLAHLLEVPVSDLYDWIEQHAVANPYASTPAQEIEQLFAQCLRHDASAMIVSSPVDLLRSVQTAVAAVADDRFASLRHRLHFAASDVDRSEAAISKVIIASIPLTPPPPPPTPPPVPPPRRRR